MENDIFDGQISYCSVRLSAAKDWRKWRGRQLQRTHITRVAYAFLYVWALFATLRHSLSSATEKNGFVTATKLETTNNFFVAATRNFAAATKRFVARTKHFVVTKYFCYPSLKKWFCWYNKTFYTVSCALLQIWKVIFSTCCVPPVVGSASKPRGATTERGIRHLTCLKLT